MSLKDRAAELAGRTEPQPSAPPAADLPGAWAQPEELPDPGIPEPPDDGPEQVPVHVAWSRVMATVRAVGKVESGTGIAYKFRGVDTALNVFGPACRLHGVLVLPVDIDPSYRDTKTSTGKPTRECTVKVTYRIVGPAGDALEVQSAGEALDSGDKGTAQALAVALRTLLFHAGLVPTQDLDPDRSQLERGEAPVRPATDYRDEALDPRTSRQRMHQIHHELKTLGRMGELVMNETGDEEQIGALVFRVGKERFASGGDQ